MCNNRTHPNVRQLKPQHGDRLQRIVPWNIVQDESQRDALRKVEKAKEDPVGEPLDVILWRGAFEGFKGEVRWKGPSNEVRDRCGERVDEMEEGEKEDGANSQDGLGHLRVLLKRVQHCILCELSPVVSIGREMKQAESRPPCRAGRGGS